jgi:hypothetical protein
VWQDGDLFPQPTNKPKLSPDFLLQTSALSQCLLKKERKYNFEKVKLVRFHINKKIKRWENVRELFFLKS